MIVETKNASLDTLAVTIQALHVSGKQMTLAVFRQLPEISAFNADGTLNDELEHWGIVRYQVEKAAGAVWIVASKNGVLYRCPAREGASISVAQRRLETLRLELAASPQAWLAYEAWVAYETLPFAEQVERRRFDHGPRHARKPDLSTEDWAAAVKAAEVALEIQITYQQSERRILNLPQLFIAV